MLNSTWLMFCYCSIVDETELWIITLRTIQGVCKEQIDLRFLIYLWIVHHRTVLKYLSAFTEEKVEIRMKYNVNYTRVYLSFPHTLPPSQQLLHIPLLGAKWYCHIAFIYSSIHLFINRFIYRVIHSFIHSSIWMHLFKQK